MLLGAYVEASLRSRSHPQSFPCRRHVLLAVLSTLAVKRSHGVSHAHSQLTANRVRSHASPQSRATELRESAVMRSHAQSTRSHHRNSVLPQSLGVRGADVQQPATLPELDVQASRNVCNGPFLSGTLVA